MLLLQESEKYRLQKRGAQPPHIFAVADSVYQDMLGLRGTQPRNQCILFRQFFKTKHLTDKKLNRINKCMIRGHLDNVKNSILL